MNARIPIVLVTLYAGLAHAQVQGIVSGYSIDARRGALRGVLGAPGAARLGDDLILGAKISDGIVRGGRAIVISAGRPEHVYVVNNLGAAAPAVITLSSTIPAASQAFLNQTGTVALLYSPENALFQFVSGIDSTPRPGSPFAQGMLNGQFSAATILNSGASALLASTDQTGSYIQRISTTTAGEISTVAHLPGVRISSIAFAQNGLDALVTDTAGDQVLLLPNIGQGAPPVVLAGPADGIQLPQSVLALDDTSIAVIGNGVPVLWVIGAKTGGVLRKVALPESPTRLDPLDTAGVLACTGIGPGPLLLVDSRRDFSSFFVPMEGQ